MSRFVPQANRALRPFNIYLNTRTQSKFSLSRIFRSSPTPSSSPTHTHSNSSTTSTSTSHSPAPLSRRTSSSSSHSSSSIRSTRGNRSPPPSPTSRFPPLSPPPPPPLATRGVPLAPIPPASNPRGELIFSSRVSAVFREGYERYRLAWEKRRDEQLGAHTGGGKKKYWYFSRIQRTKSGNGSTGGNDREVSPPLSLDSQVEKRGRSSSISSESREVPSRHSSPLRLPAARMSRRNSGASTSSSTCTTPFSENPPSRGGSPDIGMGGSRGVGVERSGKLKEGEVVRAGRVSNFKKTMDEIPGVSSGSRSAG